MRAANINQLDAAVGIQVVGGGEIDGGLGDLVDDLVAGGGARAVEADEDLAAPEAVEHERGEVDLGYDAKVGVATFERFEQVGAASLVGVDDLTAGQQELVVEDVVDDPAHFGLEERLAAAEGDSADADVLADAAWETDVAAVKGVVGLPQVVPAPRVTKERSLARAVWLRRERSMETLSSMLLAPLLAL